MSLKLKISWKCYFSFVFPHCLLISYFTNTVTSVLIQANSPCNKTELNEFQGTITSPEYSALEQGGVECESEILSAPNSALRITILYLDISEDDNCPEPPCCSHHHLSITWDGGSVLLCRKNTTERTFTVFQRLTSIKYFSARTMKQDQGFKITYTIEKNACQSNEFSCKNGGCYPASSFCNGVKDCEDGSDEINCFHVSHISRYDTLKKKMLEHANQYIEDQEICKEGSVRCLFSPDHCYFPTTDLCDGKFDCPKGEDEVGCVPECPEKISCSSGDGCYYPVHRCNSIRNCRDNSDETGCPSEPCIAMQFTCLNGACISGSAICDGDDDCGDFSDEENCTKSSFMKAAVVGLLTCIMLFCVVLGCMYHVYTARLRASANFVHQLETEPSDEDFIYREPPPAYSVAVNDPRIITYPSAEITERYFDNDPVIRFQDRRNSRSRRRQASPGNSESTPIQQSRPRSSATIATPPNSQPKAEGNDKVQDRAGRPDYHRHLEFGNFVCQSQPSELTLPTNSCQNESPCSSPSLSPSRESITSCTSLEDIEELVSVFHQ